MKSNYIHCKVWDKITYPFPNFNVQPLKFGNGSVISSHTLIGMWLLINAGITQRNVLKGVTGALFTTDTNSDKGTDR